MNLDDSTKSFRSTNQRAGDRMPRRIDWLLVWQNSFVAPFWCSFQVERRLVFEFLTIAFSSGRLKTLANLVLLVIMLGAIYTHYALHDQFDRMTPGLIFGLLLFTRLIITRTSSSSLQAKVTTTVKNEKQQKVDWRGKRQSNDLFLPFSLWLF